MRKQRDFRLLLVVCKRIIAIHMFFLFIIYYHNVYRYGCTHLPKQPNPHALIRHLQMRHHNTHIYIIPIYTNTYLRTW